jgi:hypothetical protein
MKCRETSCLLTVKLTYLLQTMTEVQPASALATYGDERLDEATFGGAFTPGLAFREAFQGLPDRLSAGVWLATDLARLRSLLPRSAAPLTCRTAARMVVSSGDGLPAAINAACAVVNSKTAEDEPMTVGLGSSWIGVEIWYLHIADWALHAHELVSQKGTWLKTSVSFSWETPDGGKLYVAPGVVVPIVCYAGVSAEDQKVHAWAAQHRRAWLRQTVLRELREQQKVWYVYWPDWTPSTSDTGVITGIIAQKETYVKRTCQMSWDLKDFEKVKVAPNTNLRLIGFGLVDAPWELSRHQHVDKHRRIILDTLQKTSS